MTIKIIFQHKKFRYALGAISLALLAGCNKVEPAPTTNANPQQVADAPAVVVAAPQAQVPVEVAADYMYYPGYEVYYSPDSRVYWYMQGGGWVSGSSVPGISIDVLGAAPSVRMNFHDSPANHHAAVVQQYPRTWQPAAQSRAQPAQVQVQPLQDRGQPGQGRGPDEGRGPPDDGRDHRG
jgi:hypothetical protein